MLPAPGRHLDAAPHRRPVAALAAPALALLVVLGVLLVACAGQPAPVPLGASGAARLAVPSAPTSSLELPPPPPSPIDAPSAAAPNHPPLRVLPGWTPASAAVASPGVAASASTAPAASISSSPPYNKVKASEECLAWRRRALLQQHAPAGLASIERVRIGPGMDGTTVRAALEPAVGQALGCYEEALRIRPNLQGRLAVRLTLDAQGCVTHAVDAGSTLANPSTLRCAMYSFISASLPVPSAAPATPTAIALTVALPPDPSREQAPLEQ